MGRKKSNEKNLQSDPGSLFQDDQSSEAKSSIMQWQDQHSNIDAHLQGQVSDHSASWRPMVAPFEEVPVIRMIFSAHR